MLTLREIAKALRGDVAGLQVLAPGPGHSSRDRSLSVRQSPGTRDGFVVHSHCGDDFRSCRDHVAAALGLASDRWRSVAPPDPAVIERQQEARRRAEQVDRAEAERLRRKAGRWWREALHPAGTIVETYLRSRSLNLPQEIAGEVLRFHPACPWAEGTAPAMVAPIRDVRTGGFIGLHRTALTPDGRKLGRKIFGSATAGAVMLDGFAEVGSGLTVGEGIETCLAARQIGLAPVWSLISTSNIGALPVLEGIEALTLLREVDTAPNRPSERACGQAAERWYRAGRHVDLVFPRIGKDMADALCGEVAA